MKIEALDNIVHFIQLIEQSSSIWRTITGSISLIVFVVGLCVLIFRLFSIKKINKDAQKQLNCFKKDGKYIEDLFLELDNTKEFLRYFIYGEKWKSKLIRLFNQYWNNEEYSLLKNKLIDKKIRFNIPFYKNFISLDKLEDLLNKNLEIFADDWHRLNKEKFREVDERFFDVFICATPLNPRHIKTLFENVQSMKTKILLLKGSAGNGKTNLLCSMVRLILNLGNPCIFINSRDIKTEIKKYFFEKLQIPPLLKSFPDIWLWLLNFRSIVTKQKLFVVLDAINENDEETFKNSLVCFMNYLQKYSHIKLLLSCRSEYFEHRFEQQFQGLGIQPYIYDLQCQYSDIAKELLIEKYRKHFNFTGTISNLALLDLFSSLLLIRIFFEVYKNKSDTIINLNRYEIYQSYVNSVNTNNSAITAANLINRLASKMVELNQFDEMLATDLNLSSDELTVLRQIVDENMLMGRVIKQSQGTITEREEELFYFAFDELRDYCFSKYILTQCEQQNPDTNYAGFFTFINTLNVNKSSPLEGILMYSYNHFRSNSNTQQYCRTILNNLQNNSIQPAQQNRHYYAHNNELHPKDIGINIIFSCNQSLLDFERQYLVNLFNSQISNYLQNDFVWLFKLLMNDEGDNRRYGGFDIFIEILLNISDENTLKQLMQPFGNHNDEHRILEYMNEHLQNNISAHYTFLTILSFCNENFLYSMANLNQYSQKTELLTELTSKIQCKQLRNFCSGLTNEMNAVDVSVQIEAILLGLEENE